MQVRVLRVEGDDFREHAPWPAYAAVRYKPRERVPQGRVRFAAAKGIGNRLLPVWLADAETNSHRNGKGKVYGNKAAAASLTAGRASCG